MSLFSIEVRGKEELEKKLLSLSTYLNTEQVLDESAAILLNRIRTRFLDKIDPDGEPWIPSEAGRKREASGGPGTLFDTGRLFRSLQLFASGKNERSIGTDVEYGPPLQFGYTRTSKNGITNVMPPRVFLGFGAEDVEVAEKLIVRRIEGILK